MPVTVHFSPLYNGWQGFGNTGLPLNGGKLYTYDAGTVTPRETYTTSAGTVQNTNPIVLDSSGRPPQEVWLIEGFAYKLQVQDSLGNILATYDNITGINDFNAGSPSVLFSGNVDFEGTLVSVGSPTFKFVGAGQRFQADFSNATIANRLIFQSSTTNGNTDLVAIPNGAATQSSFNVFNGTDTANSAFGHIAISNGVFSIQSSKNGSGTLLPMTFTMGAGEFARFDTSGNLLVGTTTSPTDGSILRVGGLMKIDNSAAFMAHRNGVDQAGVASGVNTQIQLTNTDFNVGSYFNTGTFRYIPPAGTYGLLASVGVSGSTDGARYASILYKNGAAIKEIGLVSGGTAGLSAGAFTVVQANGTDYFELFYFQSSGGPVAVSGSTVDTYLCGFRIG